MLAHLELFGNVVLFWSSFIWLLLIILLSDKPKSFICLLFKSVSCFPDRAINPIEAAAISKEHTSIILIYIEYSAGSGAKRRAMKATIELSPHILQLLIQDWCDRNLAISSRAPLFMTIAESIICTSSESQIIAKTRCYSSTRDWVSTVSVPK